MRNPAFLAAGLALGTTVTAAEPSAPAPRADPSQPVAVTPAPTHANVAYGAHERQVLDVWLPPGPGPHPCVMHIHGGGWLHGDKTRFSLPGAPGSLLDRGIALVSINYRFLQQTIIDSGSTRGTGPIRPRGDYPEPPVAVPLGDAARALQFVRSRAAEWGIDPRRIGVAGGSAGACSALWLTFHDDLADPRAEDPVARQSTRPCCAAVEGAQTSLDPAQLLEWIPNAIYGGHAFGYLWDRSDPTVEIRSFLADRAAVAGWIATYSPYALVRPGAPPVCLVYGDLPERGKPAKDPTHAAAYGALLAEKLAQAGVPFRFVHQGNADPACPAAIDFLAEMLGPGR